MYGLLHLHGKHLPARFVYDLSQFLSVFCIQGTKRWLIVRLIPRRPAFPKQPSRCDRPGIDHDQVERAGGNGGAGLPDEPGRGPHIMGGVEVVGDIEERAQRPSMQEPPLYYLRNLAGARTEISGEGDDAGNGCLHPTPAGTPRSRCRLPRLERHLRR